jgi:hypothetical protein
MGLTGGLEHITEYPDGGTRIHTNYMDGTVEEVVVHGGPCRAISLYFGVGQPVAA